MLTALSFPPWGYDLLVFVSLIPFLLAAFQTTSISSAIACGLGFSFAFGATGFYWLFYILRDAMGSTNGISLLICGVFYLVNYLHYTVLAIIIWYINRSQKWSTLQRSFIVISSFIILEWFYPRFFGETLANVVYQRKWVIQLVSVFGVAGLSGWIFVMNYYGYLLLKRESALRLKHHFVFCVILLGLTSFGHYQYLHWSELVQRTDRSLKVAVIQANTSLQEKILAEAMIPRAIDAVVSKYIELTKRALQSKEKPELILWPETAFPASYMNPSLAFQSSERIMKFQESIQIPLAFGALESVNSKTFNSYYLLNHSAKHPQVYRKKHLVPFVESASVLSSEFISRLIPRVKFFNSGEGALVHEFAGTKVAIEICYEVMHSQYSVNAKKNGANWIINPVSITWFYTLTIIESMHAAAVLRAVENRLPVLMVSNTGAGALIQSNGDIVGQTPVNTEAVMHYQIPIISSQSAF